LSSEVAYFNEHVFAEFLEKCFGFDLVTIRDAVQYMAKFFALPLKYEPPQMENDK